MGMSRRELEVGAFVQFSGLETGHMAPEASYRIEQLLTLDSGATLYKIRSDAEPFDRIANGRQLTRTSNKSQA
jgi:hypothetical protein